MVDVARPGRCGAGIDLSEATDDDNYVKESVRNYTFARRIALLAWIYLPFLTPYSSRYIYTHI